jgi:hypothetical protein
MKLSKNVIVAGLSTVLMSAGIAATALSGVSFASTEATDATNADKNRPAVNREARPEIDFSKVTRAVEKTATGVIETITSTDAKIVTKLQSMKAPEGQKFDGQISVIQTNIANGIQREISSTDATVVTKIQERAENNKGGFGFGGGGHGQRGPGRGGKMGGIDLSKVTRTVTNLDNGVQITMTSTDAAVVTKLQEFEAKMKDRPTDAPADMAPPVEEVQTPDAE